MKTTLDWETAKKHLDEVRDAYTKIGASGLLALNFSINPLLLRFERGERSQELFNEIMKIEL